MFWQQGPPGPNFRVMLGIWRRMLGIWRRRLSNPNPVDLASINGSKDDTEVKM